MWSNSRTPKVCTKFWSSCVRHVQTWIMLPLPTRLARTSISVKKQNKERKKWKLQSRYYGVRVHWMSGFFVAGAMHQTEIKTSKNFSLKSGHTIRVRNIKNCWKITLVRTIFCLALFSCQIFFGWNFILNRIWMSNTAMISRGAFVIHWITTSS